MHDPISKDFKHGKNLKLGHYVVIEPDVIVGDNVTIGHQTTLKSGTRIGDNTKIGDQCLTSGACYIGNHVDIRSTAVVSQAAILEDYVFFGPHVCTVHQKYISYGREGKVPDEHPLIYIGFGAVLGVRATVLAGVTIAPQVIVGGGSIVSRNLSEKGIYIGTPAAKNKELPEMYLMDEPDNAGFMYRNEKILAHIKSYIPGLKDLKI